ncbi:MAG: TraB/GumN family protein, partial [Candidatus Nanohaloarchaea archaeon]
FQDFIGSKTGVMPGEEMLYAYRKSVAENREVALIDRDIRATVDRLGDVSRKEKFRALLEAGIGLLKGDEFEVSEIPEEELVDEILYELEQKFPGLHQVLVEERNQVMAGFLENLQEGEPDAEIVAFVGAAHRKEVQEMVEQ